MPLIAILNRVRDQLTEPPHPSLGVECEVRYGYLLGLAVLAYADGNLNSEEEKMFLELAEVLEFSNPYARSILDEARNADEQTILKVRGSLLDSRFKYYFILDLQIMAHQDKMIHPMEKEVLARFGQILDIDDDDVEFLIGLANAVAEDDQAAKQAWVDRFKQDQAARIKARDFSHYTNR